MNIFRHINFDQNNEFSNSLEEFASRVGERRAKEIDDMMEAALRTMFLGRMIVWATKKKHMMLPLLMSRVVGLEIRTQQPPDSLAIRYEIIYARKVIAKREIYPIEKLINLVA